MWCRGLRVHTMLQTLALVVVQSRANTQNLVTAWLHAAVCVAALYLWKSLL